MITKFKTALTTVALALGPGSSAKADSSAQGSASKPAFTLQVGDVLVEKTAQGWSTVKILAIDKVSDADDSSQSDTAHLLIYADQTTKPSMATLPPVHVLHAPLDANALLQGWERIGHAIPTAEDMVGFIAYLKSNDFARYVKVTGQDINQLMDSAIAHYRQANTFAEAKKYQQAVVEYSKAIDSFPMLFEAIDNRGITYMDLGQFDDALADFEQSLIINPNNFTAIYYKGRCLFELERYDEVKALYIEASSRFPERQDVLAPYIKLLSK